MGGEGAEGRPRSNRLRTPSSSRSTPSNRSRSTRRSTPSRSTPSRSTPRPPAAPSTDDMLEQLQKLGELKTAGVLTEDEFQAQKAKILAR